MQRILIVAVLLVCLAQPAIAQNVIGDWQGTLKVGSIELRLVLHIGRESIGALKATLDSVDQGVNGIPVTSMSISQSKLKFTVESVNGAYEGILNAAATSISGTWSQGQPIRLVFTRVVNGAFDGIALWQYQVARSSSVENLRTVLHYPRLHTNLKLRVRFRFADLSWTLQRF